MITWLTASSQSGTVQVLHNLHILDILDHRPYTTSIFCSKFGQLLALTPIWGATTHILRGKNHKCIRDEDEDVRSTLFTVYSVATIQYDNIQLALLGWRVARWENKWSNVSDVTSNPPPPAPNDHRYTQNIRRHYSNLLPCPPQQWALIRNNLATFSCKRFWKCQFK